MLVYNYHPQTGEYAGAETACESPLEPGVYLLPAHGTTDEPPAAGPGYVAVYRDGAWSLVEDHRGETRSRSWAPSRPNGRPSRRRTAKRCGTGRSGLCPLMC